MTALKHLSANDGDKSQQNADNTIEIHLESFIHRKNRLFT
jgi:hypothetical protein